MKKENVLESPIAGQWYTANPVALEKELSGYIDQADPPVLDQVIALLMPHAGYRYSGSVAAFAVKEVVGKTFKRVIIIGPSHHVPIWNAASVPDATAYATPLGTVPLDTDMIEALKATPWFKTVPQAHFGEHSVQIELPFLQIALEPGFKLVPIVVGQIDADAARAMAKTLREFVDDETLVVISSDFTHHGVNYGFSPFKENTQARIKELDSGAWAFIEKRDLDGFLNYIQKTGATICGRSAIAVLLAMLPEDAEPHRLKYDTSGRMLNDHHNSVSYLAAAFTGQWPADQALDQGVFSAEEEKTLLRLARETLTYYLRNHTMPTPEDLGVEITPAMKQVMGAFVTLHRNGQLRGCIGEIFPRREVYKAIMDHAVDAGTRDGRFMPVTLDELPAIDFEISALTPPHRVNGYEEIQIGRHGMVIEKKGRSAVFLPQVAPEQGWDLPTTLSYLSRKAGLPPDAWKVGAKFEVFEATVFGEKMAHRP